MDLGTLISALSVKKAALPALDSAYCQAHGIRSEPNPLPFYVEPGLSGPSELAPVLLISAPAAVGKTTLARHLHTQLAKAGQAVLYIPLQNTAIGQDFFTGRLAGVFPTLSKSAFLETVFSGQLVLLFDGYDEVTMRSDQIERNKLFIEEIVRELDQFEKRGGKARPSIAFLFRSVFADFGVFDALAPRASAISVQFFDQPRRKQFLSRYLDVKAEADPLNRPSKGHLASSFLDGFENTLARAKDEAAAFFGHAIVLSAFGDFLHEQEEQNAARLAESLTGDKAVEATAVALLSKIIKNILEREVGKFPNLDYEHLSDFVGYSTTLQETLLSAVAEVDLYRRGNQVSGALTNAITDAVSAMEALPSFRSLKADERDKLRAAYRNELDKRITHHPFVDFKNGALSFRNPVYREYYLAKLVASTPRQNWEIVTRVNDCSHYLGLFFLHCIAARNLSGHESFLFHLISLLATSSSGNDFLFRLEWRAQDKVWVGTVEANYLRVDPFFLSEPILTLQVPLRGVLQNVAFVGDSHCLIEMSGPGAEHAHSAPIVFRECLLEAGDITFSASSIRFEGATIVADTLQFSNVVASLGGLNTLSVRNGASGDTQLSLSEYARARWESELRSCIGSSGSSGEELFRKKLSKMLLWFRKHGRSDYGCYDKKFQTCALNGKKDADASALSDFLFANGYLTRDESLIVMNQDAFAGCDIYYGKQNELSFGPRASTLYSQLAGSTFGTAFR